MKIKKRPLLTYYHSLKKIPKDIVDRRKIFISPRLMNSDDLLIFLGKYKDQFLNDKKVIISKLAHLKRYRYVMILIC